MCAKQDKVRVKTKVVRKSGRQKAGDSALKKLLQTHEWRNQHNNTSMADDQLLQMVRECKLARSDGKVKDNVKELRAKVKIMEETMMSGDVVWAQQVLVRFLSRASVMEIRKSCPLLFESTKRTKEERVQDMFVQQIRDFVTIITETKVPTSPLVFVHIIIIAWTNSIRLNLVPAISFLTFVFSKSLKPCELFSMMTPSSSRTGKPHPNRSECYRLCAGSSHTPVGFWDGIGTHSSKHARGILETNCPSYKVS